MRGRLLENMFAYKKTAALLAAFRLGLFRQIKEHGCLTGALFRQLGWNEKYTELLCIYLTGEGYLTAAGDAWRISAEFESRLDAFELICRHESSLYHGWLSPERIAESIQSAQEGRLFDKEGFTRQEGDAYGKTMYGANLNLIALHIFRRLKLDRASPVRCLEYGRSEGQMGLAFKKHLFHASIDTAPLGHVIDSGASYDVIFIYNTIHYKTPGEWKDIFRMMRGALGDKGVISISDVFYKEGGIFESTVLLDWITHGGVYNIYSHDVIGDLRAIGFTKVEQRAIDSISTDLIFAYK